MVLRLSNLRKRLFLAESKVRHFEEKYKVTLAQLDAADDITISVRNVGKMYTLYDRPAGSAETGFSVGQEKAVRE